MAATRFSDKFYFHIKNDEQNKDLMRDIVVNMYFQFKDQYGEFENMSHYTAFGWSVNKKNLLTDDGKISANIVVSTLILAKNYFPYNFIIFSLMYEKSF